MIIRVGLENETEGRSLAWALDFPGSFAYGPDESTALLGIPQAMLRYESWVAAHTADSWIQLGDFDIRLVDTWQVYNIDANYREIADGYEVNAWFKDDWRPLSDEEISRGLKILSWCRMDLLAVVHNLSNQDLDAEYPHERWSIRGILNHVANAEWWYLDRLELTHESRQNLPDDVFTRLEFVRKETNQVLPGLVGSDQVIGKQGEFWSPRKLIRRVIWHELDHVDHIGKLTGLKGL